MLFFRLYHPSYISITLPSSTHLLQLLLLLHYYYYYYYYYYYTTSTTATSATTSTTSSSTTTTTLLTTTITLLSTTAVATITDVHNITVSKIVLEGVQDGNLGEYVYIDALLSGIIQLNGVNLSVYRKYIYQCIYVYVYMRH